MLKYIQLYIRKFIMKKLRKIKKINDFLKFKFLTRYIFIIINGHSMSPTLKNMSLRIVDKYQNDIKKINRFDVLFITKKSSNSLRTKYVKRVIGLPNEWIEIKNNKLFVNGKEVECKYWLKREFRDNYVWDTKPDEIVIIGDNLEYSTDSRKIGPVGIDCIIGKVI